MTKRANKMTKKDETYKPEELAIVLAESKEFPIDIAHKIAPFDTITETRGLYVLLRNLLKISYTQSIDTKKVDKNVIPITKEMQNIIRLMHDFERAGFEDERKTIRKPDVVISIVSETFTEKDKEKIARKYFEKIGTIDVEFEEVNEDEE